APQAGDLFVLNYALTLEHLESAFYREVATRFSAEDFRVAGFDPNIRTQMQLIGAHEDTHVQVLSQVIEATFGAGSAVPPCEYNFPLDSVATVVAVASALERTGVSAYDGAVKFIVDDAIKTAGASIATVEGRHAAILNAINTQKVQVNNQIVTANINPAPAPFDTPLGFTPVFSIAAPFIRQCPFALPVQPFPSLSLSRP
ncbi:ferritin-like domain-containing protein, partial [Gaertneriomyces semiglobifer]